MTTYICCNGWAIFAHVVAQVAWSVVMYHVNLSFLYSAVRILHVRFYEMSKFVSKIGHVILKNAKSDLKIRFFSFFFSSSFISNISIPTIFEHFLFVRFQWNLAWIKVLLVSLYAANIFFPKFWIWGSPEVENSTEISKKIEIHNNARMSTKFSV